MTYASISKANALLTYKPRPLLEKGMVQSIDWYLLYSGEQLLCAPECANAQRCICSPFDAIQGATEGCSLVVFTNNVGDVHVNVHEPLNGQSTTEGGGEICYIVFTSSIGFGKSPASKWRQIFVQLSNVLPCDSRRFSRPYKTYPSFVLCPHLSATSSTWTQSCKWKQVSSIWSAYWTTPQSVSMLC